MDWKQKLFLEVRRAWTEWGVALGALAWFAVWHFYRDSLPPIPPPIRLSLLVVVCGIGGLCGAGLGTLAGRHSVRAIQNEYSVRAFMANTPS